MVANVLSPFRTTVKVFVLILCAAIIAAACGKSPAAEGPPPVQETQLPTSQDEEPIASPTLSPAEPQATDQPPAGSNLSACDLVTKEEAAAAIGTPVSDPVEENYPPLYGCSYDAANLNKVGIVLVEYFDAQQAVDAFQMELDLNDYEEVGGIGDRALRPAILDITAIKGKYEVSISLVNDEDKETRYEKAKQLVMLALTRLP